MEKATFLKTYCVLSRKISKRWVFGGIEFCTKTLRNSTVWLPWCFNSPDRGPFRWKRCLNRKRQLWWKKNCVLIQKTSKTWVFWSPQVCTETLRKVTLWLRWRLNSHNGRVFRCALCGKFKRDNLLNKKMPFGPKKHRKELVFWFSWQTPSETLRNFGQLLRSRSHSQASYSFDSRTCESNIKR